MGGAIGVVVAVVALLAITALAGREPLSGAKPILPGVLAPGRAGSVSPAALALLEGAALIALLSVLGAFMAQRPRRKRRALPIGRSAVVRWSIRVAAIAMPIALAIVIAAAAILGSHRGTHPLRAGSPSSPRGLRIAPIHRVPVTTYNLPGWVGPAALGALAAGFLLAMLVPAVRARRVSSAEQASDSSSVSALSDAIAISLDQLRTEPDPRRAVIAAYRRMEGTLAGVGVPPALAEAPREYTGRALNRLELRPRPMETLTSLFEQARFGSRRIEEPLREQAIAALMALHDELGGGAMGRQRE